MQILKWDWQSVKYIKIGLGFAGNIFVRNAMNKIKNLIVRIINFNLSRSLNFWNDYVNDLTKKHNKTTRKLREENTKLKANIYLYEAFINDKGLEKKYQKYIDDNIEKLEKEKL